MEAEIPMDREDLYQKISLVNDRRMVLIVLDGLGGLPEDGRTELETARTPNLDRLARHSELGLTHPVSLGITPGSGPAHIALFGYDPVRYPIGRGILEALGCDVEVGQNDVAVRGNFATQNGGVITDRRAGRISTEKNRELIAHLRKKIPSIDEVDIGLFSGEEHRFVLILRGAGLDDDVTDADPETTGKPIQYAKARSTAAERTAAVLNTFINRVTEELTEFTPANTCLLRGAAKYPDIPALRDIFLLKPAAIAVYPMYRGLAQLVGMDVLQTGTTVSEEIRTLQTHFTHHDFFFLHVKKTDSYGEDGDFDRKVAVIESFDELLPEILDLKPDVLAITGDHSTPSLLKSHSWHPNPLLLHSPYVRLHPETAGGFSESTCARGVLGQFSARHILPLMMANALKFKKYGA